MSFKPFLTGAAVLILSTSVFASQNQTEINNDAQLLAKKLSHVQLQLEQAQLRQIRLDWALAPIHDRHALLDLASKHSVLDVLSPAAKQQFVESVVFSENGVGSYDYQPLESELTATQAYRILALIGVQNTLPMITGLTVNSKLDAMLMSNQTLRPAGWEGYYCESRGTCAPKVQRICTQSC